MGRTSIPVSATSAAWSRFRPFRTEAEKAPQFPAHSTNSRLWSSRFKSFVATPVLLRLPLSFRRVLELKRFVGTHRMFGKTTVVVIAKTKKKRGARIQDRRQRAIPASRSELRQKLVQDCHPARRPSTSAWAAGVHCATAPSAPPARRSPGPVSHVGERIRLIA